MKTGDKVEGAGEMVEGDETDDIEQLPVGVTEPAKIIEDLLQLLFDVVFLLCDPEITDD